MKWMIRGVVIVVALVIVAAVVGVLYIDVIVRTGIERGTTYATGVETTLAKADVGLTSGELALSELQMANPDGFESPQFMSLGTGEVAVALGSLRQDTVRIPHIGLHELTLTLEKAEGKENYKVILENLERLSSGEKQPSEDEGEGKKFVIDEIVIDGVQVKMVGYPVPGPIKVAPIRMTDVGSDGTGVELSQVTGIVIRSVFASLLSSPEAMKALPGALADGLGSGLEGLGGLGDAGLESGGKVLDSAGKVLKDAGAAAEGLGDEAGKLKEGIGGLIGGKKSEGKSEEEKQE